MKWKRIVPHGSGPLSANYVIGEVLYFHVASRLLTDGVLDPRRVDYVTRMGADWYARALPEAMFEMPRSISSRVSLAGIRIRLRCSQV